jgi:negative regulator of flagellin synthesis FlgM
MTIDRIGHLDPIQPGKKSGRNDYVRGGDKTDSISLSSEAREKAEIYQVVELIKSAPELSADRIAELREKINDPSYINERIINATADKIMDAFGL